jgi:hypothetical protein
MMQRFAFEGVCASLEEKVDCVKGSSFDGSG